MPKVGPRGRTLNVLWITAVSTHATRPSARLRIDTVAEVGGGGSPAVAGRTKVPKSIDLAELKRLRAEGVQLVDVLAPDEYAEEHLPGAVNIPLKQLDAQAVAQLDRRKPVAVYCHDAL
jgi:Rhodanese-like domain